MTTRRATDWEVRHYGIQWCSSNPTRQPMSVKEQANQVRKRIGRNRSLYVQQYAEALGISYSEARARIAAQKRGGEPEA